MDNANATVDWANNNTILNDRKNQSLSGIQWPADLFKIYDKAGLQTEQKKKFSYDF